MIMISKKLVLASLLIFLFLSSVIALHGKTKKRFGEDDEDIGSGFKPVVKREERKIFVDNEFGKISAVDVGDGIRGPYRIHFFTLEPNSLLLPTLLHADMVLFVHTGSGELSWVDENETKTVKLKRGDIFRLQSGSVFFVQSDLETERQSLRIYALFYNTENDLFDPEIGAYSSIRNLLRGFDKTTLKQAFKVSDEVIESITSATDTQEIVHAISTKKDEKDQEKKKKKKQSSWEIEDRFLKAYLRGIDETSSNKKKKTKGKGYNLFDEDPDFENCNGWSLTVNPRRAEHVLGETNIGLFMVNLTKGSMMGPHWNPRATEIAIVLQGQGMVRVVCSSGGANRSVPTGSECKNTRFMVKEGDVFAVPRFRPMAQMSFNNDSLVFMGFSTTRRENHPQFLAGKQSVLQSLDGDVLALSFNVPNTMIARLRATQADSVILDCTSCAEEEARKMEEEEEEEEREKQRKEKEERQRQEEEEREKQRQEEEEKEKERERQEEEEREKQRQEEEERERKQQEEEAKRKEEEEQQRKEEEERQRKEEEEREKQRQEEEERQRKQQEEKRERQEEEKREIQRQEEEERQRKQQEEERQRQEEEEREIQRQEEEERERQRQEEEGGEGRVFLKLRTD